MKLFSPDNTHWYDRNGTPMHSVRGSNGELRAATLRDARRLNLLPSVTNVLGVVAKPELTIWLQEQAILAALTLPRSPDEPIDEFARRVAVDSQQRRQAAADFGTAIHAGAEAIALGQPLDPLNPLLPWLDEYRAWYETNCRELHWSEKVLVCPELGYAGTADLLINHRVHGLTLVDLKTQSIRPGQKPRGYRTWSYQLAGYRKILGQDVSCLNLIINSALPEAPVEHLWSEEEMKGAKLAFDAARTLWAVEKDYDPRRLTVES